MGKVTITRADGELGTIDESELEAAKASGFRVVAEDEAQSIVARREAQSAGGMLEGGAESVGRGLSFGLTDVAARNRGADMGARSARKENLGDLGTGLELVGAAAPALLTGGSSTAATAAGTAARVAARVAARTPAGTVARLGLAAASKAGGGAARRFAVEGAVEGALQGAGSIASEDALGDRDLSAERMLVGAGNGAVLGGLLGGGMGAAGSGLAAVARGGQRVSKGAFAKIAGLGDDLADPSVRSALAKGGSFIDQAQHAQLRAMSASVDDHGALTKISNLSRSKEGRQLVLDAKSPGEFGDLVGGRLKSSWKAGDPADALGAYGKAFAKDARKGGVSSSAEHFARFNEKMGRVTRGGGEAADTILEIRTVMRRGNKKGDLFERMAKGSADAPPNAHKYVSQTIDALDDVLAKRAGMLGTEAIQAEVGKLRTMADDPLLWGQRVGAARPLYAARKLEREAIEALPVKARKALEGGALDDAGARALASKPEQVQAVIKARSQLADVLEGAGEDVSKLRQGLDDMRGALRYSDDLADANGAWGKLRALEDSPGAMTARLGLEGGATLLGGALGGLGGAIGGKMAGQLLRGATRPSRVATTLARMRQTIDAVTGRESGIIAGAERLAQGGVKAARSAAKAGRTAARGSARGARSAAARGSRDRPSGRSKALEQVRRSVVQLAARPEEIPERLGPEMSEIREVAPKIAETMAARTAAAVAFLAAKAPRGYSAPFSKDVLVDPTALETFGRYVDAVQDPVGAIEAIESGGLALEHAEALRAVYPSIYQELREGVLDMVGNRADAGKPVSELALVQLGMLLQLPLASSQQPGIREALAAPAPAPEQPAPAPAPQQGGGIRAAAKVEHGKSATTGTQRLEGGGEHR